MSKDLILTRNTLVVLLNFFLFDFRRVIFVAVNEDEDYYFGTLI